MPRRRALTKAQLETLLALPVTDADLVRHWTLGDDDPALIGRRRRPHNQLGFALHLCALRYPGRLLRPGEIIPQPALQFVAGQLGTAPEALASYAVRFQTRYEQLGALRTALGFIELAPQQRQILEWLLPVALATTNPLNVAMALLDELRRRRIIVPSASIIERLAAAALAAAEGHVAKQLTGGLTPAQSQALEALLAAKPETAMSVLAWARLPAGAPGHAAEYLAERHALLDRRPAEVAAKAATDALEDVRIKGGDMKISPLKAVNPEAAEELAARLYAMLPAARITSLLAEVHG